MNERVILNRKEQRRVEVLNRVERGELTAAAAATLLALSMRQVRRLLAGYRQEGVAALAHGNRGRPPVTTVSTDLRERVVALARGTYGGCNVQHLSELLAEREEIRLSRSSLRRILQTAGIASPRTRRAPKHRSRRARYPQEGMLLQIDGSLHPWLEDRGPHLSLIGAIDDATGTVPHAVFRDHEDAQGYFLLLAGIVQQHGVPLALYHDRHGIFARATTDPDTREEQLAGVRHPTQFGRALQELDITSIAARSPQAKGRIERLWGTFQDRLVSELRLAGATTPEAAAGVLADFLPRFNARFAVPAEQPGTAYRPLPQELALDRVCCFKYQRTVAADNTVQLQEHRLQLLPGLQRVSYARAQVEIHERLDGSLVVYYQDQLVASQPAPLDTPTLRARGGRRGTPDVKWATAFMDARPAREGPPLVENGKPTAAHPWKRAMIHRG